jgi:hypothetical protein
MFRSTFKKPRAVPPHALKRMGTRMQNRMTPLDVLIENSSDWPATVHKQCELAEFEITYEI